MAYKKSNPNGQATMANSEPVVIASDQSAVPVSAASLPLPTGASTSAKQPAIGTAGTPSADVLTVQGATSMTALKVDGSATTQPVSGTVAVSNSFALDATLGTTNTEIGATNETAPATDTATSGLNGRLQRIAQHLTTLNTALGSPFQAGGSIGNTAFGVNNAAGASAVNIQDGGNSITVDGTVAATQSGTWTVQPGNTANTTAWKVDGSAVTQPISGTVTANAGTNLNTSALALETGGNLATVKTNTDNLALAQASATSGQKGNLVLGAVTTAAPTYTTAQSNPLSLTTAGAVRTDSSATTQPVSGSVTATQATGTNLHTVVDSGSITATQATGSNLHTVVDSGTITTVTTLTGTTTLTPGTGATNLGKAEDAAHTSGDTGVMALVVRNDTPASLVSASGDYTPPTTDANGALWVSMATKLDAANDSLALGATTTGGLTTYHLVSAATTNATNIKASAGQVYGWYIYNSNAAARKVAFHNSASAPTAGASVFMSLVIPPSSGANVFSDVGIPFSSGIGITTVTGLADSDTTAVAANDLVINIFYK